MSDSGFKFDNTYANLPEIMATKLSPVAVKKPELVILNHDLARSLGLDFSKYTNHENAEIFSGNKLIDGSMPLAQAYCGHQFGHFVMLGDGRAILLGEHIDPKNQRWDIQLKGSGKTPYSRGGDGRAALGPMLREYIVSEAIHFLNIPTTRSLAVVTTGEDVLRESKLKGAVLTRIASSHLRVGTFQYVAAKQDLNALKTLVDYAIERHYPKLIQAQNKAIALFKSVMKRQIKLIVNWMRVSFIHGVMNTDNMTISGESIDYGPCAFMDHYDTKTVFSSIDHYGRYAYGSQPVIGQWNLARFAESLFPLLDQDEKKAEQIANGLINEYEALFANEFHIMMKNKLGMISDEDQDKQMMSDLFKVMHKNQADYTNTFRYLINGKFPQEKLLNDPDFIIWEAEWKKRLSKNQTSEDGYQLMIKHNPVFIPRNHKVEEALSAADQGDMSKFLSLCEVIKKPYNEDINFEEYTKPAPASDRVYKTYCGT
ncbi:MAG: YdiU family protein [Pelagibacteraceae bacterium]|nr:YdiU family protein [Pelagibacteraceae bacterium]